MVLPILARLKQHIDNERAGQFAGQDIGTLSPGAANDPIARTGLGILSAIGLLGEGFNNAARASTGAAETLAANSAPGVGPFGALRSLAGGLPGGAGQTARDIIGNAGRGWAESDPNQTVLQRLMHANDVGAYQHPYVQGGINVAMDPSNLLMLAGPLAATTEAGSTVNKLARAAQFYNEWNGLGIDKGLGMLGGAGLKRLGLATEDGLTPAVRQMIKDRAAGAGLGAATTTANAALVNSANPNDSQDIDLKTAALLGAAGGGALGANRLRGTLAEMFDNRLGGEGGMVARQFADRAAGQGANELASGLAPGRLAAQVGSLRDRLAQAQTGRNLDAFMADAHPLLKNEDGTPKVLFHGSQMGNFDQFQVPGVAGTYGHGAYFTEEPRYAGMYASGTERGLTGSDNPMLPDAGSNIKPTYVNLKNPYVVGQNAARDYQYFAGPAARVDATAQLQALGHDGVIVPGGLFGDNPNALGEVVAFDPATQVKSATGNVGTYDRNNPNLLRSGLDPQGLIDQLRGIGKGGRQAFEYQQPGEPFTYGDWREAMPLDQKLEYTKSLAQYLDQPYRAALAKLGVDGQFGGGWGYYNGGRAGAVMSTLRIGGDTPDEVVDGIASAMGKAWNQEAMPTHRVLAPGEEAMVPDPSRVKLAVDVRIADPEAFARALPTDLGAQELPDGSLRVANFSDRTPEQFVQDVSQAVQMAGGDPGQGRVKYTYGNYIFAKDYDRYVQMADAALGAGTPTTGLTGGLPGGDTGGTPTGGVSGLVDFLRTLRDQHDAQWRPANFAGTAADTLAGPAAGLTQPTAEQLARAQNWEFQAGIGKQRPVLSETPMLGAKGQPLMQKGQPKMALTRLDQGAEYLASVMRQGTGGSGYPADPRLPVEVVGAARMMARGVVDRGQWAAEMAQDYPNIFTSPEIAKRLYDESAVMYERALQEVIDPAKTPTVARMADEIAKGLKREPRALDWYETTMKELEPIFGQDMPVFVEMLAATSPNNNVPGNVTAALKAYTEWKLGYNVGELWSDPYHTQKFDKYGKLMFAHGGYLPAHVPNLQATFEGRPWGDVKVQDFLNSFYEPYHEQLLAAGKQIPDFAITYPGGEKKIPGAWSRFRQVMQDFGQATAYTGDVWDLRTKGFQDVPQGEAWIAALRKMAADKKDKEISSAAQHALRDIAENPDSPLAKGWAGSGTILDAEGRPTTVGREAGIGVSALSKYGALTGERFRSGKEYLFNKGLGQELAKELTDRLGRPITPRQAQAGLWFAGKSDWETMGYNPVNDNLEGGPFTDYIAPQMAKFGGAQTGDEFAAGNVGRAFSERLQTIADTEFARAARDYFGKINKGEVKGLQQMLGERIAPILEAIPSFGSALPPEGDPLGARGVRPADWDAIVPGHLYEKFRQTLEQTFPDPKVINPKAPNALAEASFVGPRIDSPYRPRSFYSPEPFDVNNPPDAATIEALRTNVEKVKNSGLEFQGPTMFGAGLSPGAIGGAIRQAGVAPVAGAALGAGLGFTTDSEDRQRGALKGAGAGAVGGLAFAHLAPELGKAVSAAYRTAAPGVVDNTIISPKALSIAHEMASQAQEDASKFSGVKLTELPRQLDDAWRAQVVNTFRGLALDASSLWLLVKDFGRDYGVDRTQVKRTMGQLIDHYHDPDPIARLGDLGNTLKDWNLDAFVDESTSLDQTLGTSFSRSDIGTNKMSTPQRFLAGAAMSFTNLREAMVPAVGPIVGGIRQVYAPYVDTAYHVLNGFQHAAPRITFWNAALKRDLPQAADRFATTLAPTGIDLSPLFAAGKPVKPGDVASYLTTKYKGLTADEVGQIAKMYSEELNVTAMQSADRIAHIFGDFRDKANKPWKTFLGRVFPFSRYGMQFAPVGLEMIKRHPLIAGAAAAGIGASAYAASQNGEAPWNAGTVPISTDTPVLGALARLRLGGQDGTVRVDPLKNFMGPISSETFSMDSGLPSDTPYDKAKSLIGKIGFQPHPALDSLASLAGLTNKQISPASRTAGIEQAAELIPGMPSVPTIQGAFNSAKSAITGKPVEDYDAVARRYAELVYEQTGKPLSDNRNLSYMESMGDTQDPLWARAQHEVRLMNLVGGLMSNVTPLTNTATGAGAARVNAGYAARKTDAEIQQLAMTDPTAATIALYERNIADRFNPVTETYRGASTAGHDKAVIRNWGPFGDSPIIGKDLLKDQQATYRRKDR